MLTLEDAKRFLKKNKLTILLTSLAIMIVYIVFSLYNLYSATILEEEKEVEQELNQAEIVEIFAKDPEDITAEELGLIEDNLEANGVEFRIYVEDQDQKALSDPNLLKDFLVLEDVVDFVEAEAGVDIPIDLDLAVIVNRREGHPVLSIRLRTGNYDDNMLLASAYMTVIEEDLVPLLHERNVHILDDEPALYEPTLLTQILENMRVFSPVGLVLGTIIAAVIGAIIGSLLGVLLNKRKGKVNELEILQEESSDKVLPLYRLKNKVDKNKQIEFALLKNGTSDKLVLSEFDLEEKLQIVLTANNIDTAQDLSDSNPQKVYKRVIILTELDKTTIKWYKAQRIQLKNTTAEITIIQL